jgi:CBS domain-containing protein
MFSDMSDSVHFSMFMLLQPDNRIRHIPVVENKEMKGMVSIGDVVRAVVDEHREELQRLNSFIQGSY